MQLVRVEEIDDKVVDVISSNTPYDEGEDEYDTDNSELDGEDRERIGRIKGLTKHWMILNITWRRPWLDLSRQLEEEETKILSHDLVC